MTRLAILTEDDRVWALWAWERAIPVLLEHDHEVAGLWTTGTRFGKLTGCAVHRWYVKTFGLANFFKTACFTAMARLARTTSSTLGSKFRGFSHLAAAHGIRYFSVDDPNKSPFADWIIENNIDVVIIMTGYIIGRDIIEAPRVGILNKHASLLPANRGILPYFWARLESEPQGVSFHKVVSEIDGGAVVLQEPVPARYCRSMFSFYHFVFLHYPQMLLRAIDNLIRNVEVNEFNGAANSYHSLPCRRNYRDFAKRKGSVIRLGDLVLAMRM